MKLPQLSPLQFAVIKALGKGRVSGRDLRMSLAKLGILKSTPAFYQLMSRLEEARFVFGENESKAIDGQTIKERFYRVTPSGEEAVAEIVKFFNKSSKAFERV